MVEPRASSKSPIFYGIICAAADGWSSSQATQGWLTLRPVPCCNANGASSCLEPFDEQLSARSTLHLDTFGERQRLVVQRHQTFIVHLAQRHFEKRMAVASKRRHL